MLGNGITDRPRQFVARSLHIVVERKFGVQLGVEVFRLTGRLLTLQSALFCYIDIIGVGLYYYGLVVCLVGYNTVCQTNSLSEVTLQHLAEQVYIVGLQILIKIGTRHPYQQRLRSRLIRLEHYRFEPSLVLVGLHCIAYHGETIVP